jgi:hypothetical protein
MLVLKLGLEQLRTFITVFQSPYTIKLSYHKMGLTLSRVTILDNRTDSELTFFELSSDGTRHHAFSVKPRQQLVITSEKFILHGRNSKNHVP